MKRTLSMLLAVLMVFCLLPVQIFAAESSSMSVEEFHAAVETAVADGTDLVLDRSVVIQEDMDIAMGDSRLILTNGAQFAVVGDVTVSVDGFFWVRHGEVNVNPGSALDIKPTATVIVGAEGMLLDDVRYETEGGATFNVNGSLFCGGTLDVLPDGSLWITHEDANARIDGSSENLGAVHVISGLLEVTSTMDNSGYLAVHPAGKLQATTGSTLNILNDENGCGYLDNQGYVNLNGTVNVKGLCTTGKNSETGEGDGTMEVRGATINVSETGSVGVVSGGSLALNGTTLNDNGVITVEKDAALWINDNSQVHVNGALDNLGAVHVGFAGNGTLSVNGTLDTNGYVAVHSTGKLLATTGSTLNILNDENGCGYLDNQGFVNLAGSADILGLCTTGKNQNGEGDGTMEAWDATISVAETGSVGVVSGGSLALNGTTLNDNGVITVEKDAALWINNDSQVSVNGTLDNLGAVHVGFAGNGTLNVNGTLDTNGYLNVGATGTLNTAADSVLNILNDENGCGYLQNGGTAELEGTVELDGLCSVEGTLDMNGTVNAGETSSLGITGTVNVNGTLNGGGEIGIGEEGTLNVNDGGTASTDLIVKNEGTVQVNAGGTLTTNGTWEGNEPVTEVASVPMYRMYDPNSGEHFYTGAELERDFLVEAGWHYEGVGFNFPEEGEPVYRLYEPVYGEHLYTMDEAEVDKLVGWGWNVEGVAFNSAGEDGVPQYRLHNPNAKRGGYHFTGSVEERDLLISFGWIDEGIGWYSCAE